MRAPSPTGVERALDAAAARFGAPLGVDGPARLRERAEILGIAPQGTVSAGGTARLLRAGDGAWFALNLARRDDVDLLAAWMGHEWDGPPWDAVARAVPTMCAADAVARAQLLGIPAAVAVPPAGGRGPLTTPAGRARSARGSPPLVVDLAALWAGPLCARLVGDALGALVVKVEDRHRPDGARAGPPEFWRRLNGGKEDLTLDLASPDDRARLDTLLATAAVVVTSARPRAFTALGIQPGRAVARGAVWVAITGYGWSGPRRDWVAFGDDAAVAGGAAVAAGGPDAPVFVLDAVADPLAGLAGAATAVACVRAGRAAFVDVSMRDVVSAALEPEYAAPMAERGEP